MHSFIQAYIFLLKPDWKKFEDFHQKAKYNEFKGNLDQAADNYLDAYYYFQKAIKWGAFPENTDIRELDKTIKGKLSKLDTNIPESSLDLSESGLSKIIQIRKESAKICHNSVIAAGSIIIILLSIIVGIILQDSI